MTDQSETFNLKMLEDIIDATSSQVLDCGITRCNSQDGVINQCGQEAAPASRFHLPDDKKVKQMIATYGPNGSGSLRSVALQRSMESRLLQRLPTGGLTMFIKGWSRKATPLGRLYCQLAASVRPIEGRDYGLWPTPKASEATKDQRTMKGAKQEVSRGKGPSLSAMAMVMWPTVTVTDANKRGDVSPRKNAMGLSETAALWPTVNASDHRDRGSYDDPCIQRRVQKGKQIGLTMIAQGTGKMGSGSTVQTENKGSLNPEFPCWLMGIPNGWVSSIVRGMQSLHKSQRNLSSQPCLEDML